MKMSEVFTGGKVVEIGGYYDNDAYINTVEHGFGTDEDGVADAAIHAINMHDELVEALEKARKGYLNLIELELLPHHGYYDECRGCIDEMDKVLSSARGES